MYQTYMRALAAAAKRCRCARVGIERVHADVETGRGRRKERSEPANPVQVEGDRRRAKALRFGPILEISHLIEHGVGNQQPDSVPAGSGG